MTHSTPTAAADAAGLRTRPASCARRLLALASLAIRELVRRRDAYVALGLLLAVLLPLGSVRVFGFEGVVRHLREIALLLLWVFSVVIATATAARQLPAEREQRTLYPLLARPVRRSEVVLGKALGAWTASLVFLAAGYLLLLVLAAFKGAPWNGPALFQAFCLHAVCLGVVTALATAGSVVLTPSANVTLSLLLATGMLLFGDRLGLGAAFGSPAAAVLGRGVRVLAPHLELFDLRHRLVHDWGPLSWAAWGQLCAYGLAYAGALLALACALFRRKPL